MGVTFGWHILSWIGKNLFCSWRHKTNSVVEAKTPPPATPPQVTLLKEDELSPTSRRVSAFLETYRIRYKPYEDIMRRQSYALKAADSFEKIKKVFKVEWTDTIFRLVVKVAIDIFVTAKKCLRKLSYVTGRNSHPLLSRCAEQSKRWT